MNATETTLERTVSPGFDYTELKEVPGFLKCLRLQVYIRESRIPGSQEELSKTLKQKAKKVDPASLFFKLTQIEVSALFIQLRSWTVFIALKIKDDPEKTRKIETACEQIQLYSTDEMLNLPFLNVLVLLEMKILGIINNPKNYRTSSSDKDHRLLNYRRKVSTLLSESICEIFELIKHCVYGNGRDEIIVQTLKKMEKFLETETLQHSLAEKASTETVNILALLKTCLTYPNELLPLLVCVNQTTDSLEYDEEEPNAHFYSLVPSNFKQFFKVLINVYDLLGKKMVEARGKEGSSKRPDIQQIKRQLEAMETKNKKKENNSRKTQSPTEEHLELVRTSAVEIMENIEAIQISLSKQDLHLFSIPENLFGVIYHKVDLYRLEFKPREKSKGAEIQFFNFHRLLVHLLKYLNDRYNMASVIISRWKEELKLTFKIEHSELHNGLFSPIDLLFLTLQCENLKLISREGIGKNDCMDLFLLHSDVCHIQHCLNQFHCKDKDKLLKEILHHSCFVSTVTMENDTPPFISYLSKMNNLRSFFQYLTYTSGKDLAPVLIHPIGDTTGQVSPTEEKHLRTSYGFITEKIRYFQKTNLFIKLIPSNPEPSFKYFLECYTLYLAEWIKNINAIEGSANGQPLPRLRQKINLLLGCLFDHVNFIDEFALTYPEIENTLTSPRKTLSLHFIEMCEPLKRFSRINSLLLETRGSRKRRGNRKKEAFTPPTPKSQISQPLHFGRPKPRVERKDLNLNAPDPKEKVQEFELEWSTFSSAQKTRTLYALSHVLEKVIYDQKDSSPVGILLNDEVPKILSNLQICIEDLLILADFLEQEKFDYAQVSSSIIKIAFLTEQLLKLHLCQQRHESRASLGEILRQHNLSFLYVKIQEFMPQFSLSGESTAWLESLDPVLKRTGRYGGWGFDPLSAFLSKICYLTSLEQLPEKSPQSQQAIRWIHGLLGRSSPKGGEALHSLTLEAWKFLHKDFLFFLHQSLDALKDLMLALDKENLTLAPKKDLKMIETPNPKPFTSRTEKEINPALHFHSSLERFNHLYYQVTLRSNTEDVNANRLNRLQYGFIHNCRETLLVLEHLLTRPFPQRGYAAFATTCLLKEGVLLEQLYYVLMSQFPLLHENQNVHVLLSELKNKPYYFCHEIQRSGELLFPSLKDHLKSDHHHLRVRGEFLEPILKNLYRNPTKSIHPASDLINTFRSFDQYAYVNRDASEETRENARALWSEQILVPCLETLDHVHLLLIFLEKLSE